MPSSDPAHKVFAMNLNSPLFDRIRVKPAPQIEAAPEQPRCDHPGCRALGEHRAPMGRLREGQYFCFCLDHVREYNHSYNYFNGMSDADVARYQREAMVGHRPTWAMGVNRTGTGHREEGVDPRRSRSARHVPRTRPRRHAAGAEKAAPWGRRPEGAGDVRASTTPPMQRPIKARYKELVKRLHPDANGGDRSLEDKLREIIHAYNYLKSAKLA